MATPQTTFANPNQDTALLAETSGVAQPEVMAERARVGYDVNPDALIGNILTSQNKSAVVDSSEAQSQLDQAGDRIATAEKDIYGRTGTIVSEGQAQQMWNSFGGDSTGFTKLSDGSWSYDSSVANKLATSNPQAGSSKTASSTGLTPAQQKLFDDAKKNAEDAYALETKQINDLTNQGVAKAEEAGRQAKGQSRSFLARIGALGVTTAGAQYIQSIQASYDAKVQDIRTNAIAALEKARIAKNEADTKTLGLMLDTIDKNVANLQKEKEAYQTSIKTALEINKLQKEDVSSTLDAIAASGLEPADDYFKALDQSHNFESGISKGIFNIAKTERQMKEAKSAMEIEGMKLSQLNSLTSILESTPMGTPITIGGFTYFGTKGAGNIQINDTTGEASVFQVGPNGEITQRSIGNVGAKADGLQFVKDEAGMPFIFNTKTGQLTPASPTVSGWDQIIPEGTYKSEAFPGMPLQCGELVNAMVGITVGSTIKEKMARMDPSLSFDTAQPGDVIVSEAGPTGHVAVINERVYRNGEFIGFRVSEANKAGPGMVTHNGMVYANDGKVKGFMNGELKQQFRTGPDNATWTGSRRGAVTFSDPTYNEVVSAIGLKNMTDADTASFTRSLKDAVDSGDKERIRSVVRNQTLTSLGEAERTKAAGRFQTLDALKTIQSEIEAFKAAGGKLGFVTGNIESIQNKLGEVKDPKLVEIATRIGDSLASYRQAITGAAFTESEQKFYNGLFPTSKGSVELNQARISGLTKNLEASLKNTISFRLSPELYDKVFNDGSSGDLASQVKGKGYDYQAMKADGMSDEAIKKAVGL